MDIFSRPLPDGSRPGTRCPRGRRRRPSSPRPPSGIAELLIGAERPLIYIGGGLRTSPARKALLTLAEHLDIPIAHSLMAKGTVPDSHPLLLGMPGFWGLEFTNAYTSDADLVLALGTRFAETDASSWHPGLHLAVPAVAARPGRHRPRGDRPQLPGGNRRGGGHRAGGRGDSGRSHHQPVRDRSRAELRATITAARGARLRGRPRAGAGQRVPAAPAAHPGRPARGAARGRGARHRRRLEQERRRAVLRAARRGAVHHARRRVHDGLRAGRRGRCANRLSRNGRWWRSSATGA